ncbi:broad-spectrum mercury transporter MerE [Salmonella enterica subsp. enterica serovar Virchow]|uniref:Mercury resistance protein n=1 Tax=Salmonella virchow TaxID=48409 RepID=A0A5H9TDB3_SALVI|nr:broad-spectrum mercury transporter MerE [Salmonella enterica]EDN4359838.1 broad-spectrum mercury transporter MerE [Salmonella enterica subsp. enterica]EGY0736122.1 broad-spectrum mercury transporter MerE [Salmonella enterica subsp. enterica serovar 6,7,[14]:r:-]EAA3244559.1 mercury resistance protein [Salmonella enterica subsp. enterica serovar Virchow]EAA4287898.1 mercury resistance protein [Salmonella enterica subsp. enterica serovar Virchow]EAA4289538.1 mercury resistance protein [Salmon
MNKTKGCLIANFATVPLWGALAVLTCPCHLPILAIVLAGTTAGAFIGEHWGIAALTLTGLFVLSVTRLLRAFKGRS